jgi:uncharacterized protein
MSERTSYPPGTFSWAELATSDADAAKAFYAQLFGWEYDDTPIGDGQVYTMATRDGGTAAALFAADQPPHWNSYVTVASADESAAKAGELGADVVQEAFDVMDVGRMAIVVDPQGAGLCLWEPRASIGATIVNAPGALTWNDLVTPDLEGSATFYGALFGWAAEGIPGVDGYSIIKNGERSNGGMALSPDGPSAWMPYFGHEDVDSLFDKIPAQGGTVLHEAMQMPAGRIGVFADPQGAAFGAWTGRYED